eukprot:s4197_g1.t1
MTSNTGFNFLMFGRLRRGFQLALPCVARSCYCTPAGDTFIGHKLRTTPETLVAAARFIGIDRATVDFHTPKPGCIEHIMYRGIRVRGVIAVADRIYEGQCVIFLDLRQVAEGVQFVVLEVPYVMLDALPALLRSRPPPGWELKVIGGRRRRDRIQVENSDTLVFGYQYICTSEPEEPPHDPTTDDSDDEGEESEDSDQAPPTSQSDATT